MYKCEVQKCEVQMCRSAKTKRLWVGWELSNCYCNCTPPKDITEKLDAIAVDVIDKLRTRDLEHFKLKADDIANSMMTEEDKDKLEKYTKFRYDYHRSDEEKEQYGILADKIRDSYFKQVPWHMYYSPCFEANNKMYKIENLNYTNYKILGYASYIETSDPNYLNNVLTVFVYAIDNDVNNCGTWFIAIKLNQDKDEARFRCPAVYSVGSDLGFRL